MSPYGVTRPQWAYTMAADGLVTLLHDEPGHQEQYCLVLLKYYSFRTKRVNPLRPSDTHPIISASASTNRFSLETMDSTCQFIFSCEMIYLIKNWLDYIFFLAGCHIINCDVNVQSEWPAISTSRQRCSLRADDEPRCNIPTHTSCLAE